MSLAFLLPLGLAALAAWLLPLLIHLRRRNEQQRTLFAALHWLPAKARPKTRLRFEEWPLLLLRLLLLAALALLLAEPVLFGGPHEKQWLVAAPGVDAERLLAQNTQGERRWLARGFPSLEEKPPVQSQPIGSLLRELDASLPADVRLTVVVPAQLDGADAVVPQLHRRVSWQVTEAAPAAQVKSSNSVLPRPTLAIRHAGEAAGLRYLRATAIAWSAAARPPEARPRPLDIAPIRQPLPAIGTPLAWLAPGPLPQELLAWVERGGSVIVEAAADVPGIERDGIVVLRDGEGRPQVRGMRYGRGRLLQWTQALTPDAMPELLQPEFPERVWSLFAPPLPPPERIAAHDYAPRTGARAWPVQPRDLQPFLLIAIAVLFVVERLLASGRRGAAPA